MAVRMDDGYRSAKGPNPIRVWVKDGITWLCMAAGSSDGTNASIALGMELLGSPFATRTPTVGEVWF
jgi:hypothetical protein